MLKEFEKEGVDPHIQLEQSIQQRLDEAFGLTLCARFNPLDQTIEISSPSDDSLLKRKADPNFFLHSGHLAEAIQKRLRAVLKQKTAPIQDPVILCEALHMIRTTSHLEFTFKRTEAGFVLIQLNVPPLPETSIIKAKEYGIELKNLGPQTKKILLFFPKGAKPHPQDLGLARAVLPNTTLAFIQRLLEECVFNAQKNGV